MTNMDRITPFRLKGEVLSCDLCEKGTPHKPRAHGEGYFCMGAEGAHLRIKGRLTLDDDLCTYRYSGKAVEKRL